MKFSLSTALIAAACAQIAAAVNIAFYNTRNCAGGTAQFVCVFQGRDRCCDPRGSHKSMEFQELSSANVELRSYNGGACSRRTADSASRGRSTVCFVREPQYTGAGWGGFSRKRDLEAGASKEECQRPQELQFADGTKFDLTTPSDEDYDAIADLKPEVPSDIPEQFQQLRIPA